MEYQACGDKPQSRNDKNIFKINSILRIIVTKLPHLKKGFFFHDEEKNCVF